MSALRWLYFAAALACLPFAGTRHFFIAGAKAVGVPVIAILVGLEVLRRALLALFGGGEG